MSRTKKTTKKGEKESSCELTEAEWAIMKVVWAEEPCAAGTVQEALQKSKNWAYSTVKTFMDRMVGKGQLSTHSIRNLQLFTSNITEAQAKRSEILKTLKRAFDGTLTPMMQFLFENEKFSNKELKQLHKMVEKARTEKE